MLKDKVCVKNEGITQEILDVMVEVAKASGFDMTAQDRVDIEFYKHNYIAVERGTFDRLASIDHPFSDINEINLEEWLFACAPDWADRVESWNGMFYYANETHFQKVNKGYRDEKLKSDLDISPVKTIYTRKQDEKEWTPNVGDEVVWDCDGKNYTVMLNPDISNDVIMSEIGCDAYWQRANVRDLKPPQKHTGNELKAYELYCLVFHRSNKTLDECKNESIGYENCLKVVESGRFE